MHPVTSENQFSAETNVSREKIHQSGKRSKFAETVFDQASEGLTANIQRYQFVQWVLWPIWVDTEEALTAEPSSNYCLRLFRITVSECEESCAADSNLSCANYKVCPGESAKFKKKRHVIFAAELGMCTCNSWWLKINRLSGDKRTQPLARSCTAWCSEIGSLTSLDAPELHASSDVREPIFCGNKCLSRKNSPKRKKVKVYRNRLRFHLFQVYLLVPTCIYLSSIFYLVTSIFYLLSSVGINTEGSWILALH